MGQAGYKIMSESRVGGSTSYRWSYHNAHGYQWMGPRVDSADLARSDFREWWQAQPISKRAKAKIPPEIS